MMEDELRFAELGYDFRADKEWNIYGSEARDDQLLNDEIDPEEEAFMRGYVGE